MPQKYIVYFNQKSIVFNNPTRDFVRNLPLLAFSGMAQIAVDKALHFIENEKDEQAKLYLQDLSWEDGIEMLKTRFTFIRAAGGLIQNPKGEFLLIHRLGQWDLPKGKIESGETDQYAAEREILEETGIQVQKPLTFLVSTYHTYIQKKKAFLKETVWFIGKSEQSTLPVAQSEEAIESAVWCSFADAEGKLTKSYPSIADVWITWKETNSNP